MKLLNCIYALRKTIKATLFTVSAVLAMIMTIALTSFGQSANSPLGDYGDAGTFLKSNDSQVSSSFPTLFKDATSDYVLHRFPGERAFLGLTTTVENNAILPNEDYDDGWFPVSAITCTPVKYEIHVTVPETTSNNPIYLNVLFDWNQDGQWASSPSECPQGTTAPATPPGQQWATPVTLGAHAVEWGIQNLRLDLPPFNLRPDFSGTIILPEVLTGSQPGDMWVRFTISSEPIDENLFIPAAFDGRGWNGEGDFLYGETEDYFTCLINDSASQLPGCPLELAQVPLVDLEPSAEELRTKRLRELREQALADAKEAAAAENSSNNSNSNDDSAASNSDESNNGETTDDSDTNDDSAADNSDESNTDETNDSDEDSGSDDSSNSEDNNGETTDDSDTNDDNAADNSDESDTDESGSADDGAGEDNEAPDEAETSNNDSGGDTTDNGSDDSKGNKDKEACNAGRGNGSEEDENGEDCDPGNSGEHNNGGDGTSEEAETNYDGSDEDTTGNESDDSKGNKDKEACNAGRGNGSEEDENGEDCDPGNSDEHNNGGD